MRVTLFSLLALVSAALAQYSTAASQSDASASASVASSAPAASANAALTPCALTCLLAAADATGCGTTDVNCACTNADFQFRARSCLQAECQASELNGVLELQAQQCGAREWSFFILGHYSTALNRARLPFGRGSLLSATAEPTATAPFTPSNSAADFSGSPSLTGSASASASNKTGGAVALWSGNSMILSTLAAAFGGMVGAVVV
ncbi:hypothetical protein B0H19DRAFT_1272532 [Mycena capillaripes]|nr:hypothetical protein B0H19DRAFT_1272474 [Mycena capillaripes]KAJ6533134.1 hypothetical protein B0H19DRAFT_1272532 [Mycena capillaripes]